MNLRDQILLGISIPAILGYLYVTGYSYLNGYFGFYGVYMSEVGATLHEILAHSTQPIIHIESSHLLIFPIAIAALVLPLTFAIKGRITNLSKQTFLALSGLIVIVGLGKIFLASNEIGKDRAEQHYLSLDQASSSILQKYHTHFGSHLDNGNRAFFLYRGTESTFFVIKTPVKGIFYTVRINNAEITSYATQRNR